MTTKNLTQKTTFIGVDVAKNWLDFSVDGKHTRINNHQKAISEILASFQSQAILVYEATGGYEKTLENQAVKSKIILKRAHPTRVRAFGKACGFAKTDILDAHLLAKFGAIDASPEHIQANPELADLSHRRRQLADMIQAERNRQNRSSSKIKASYDKILKVLIKELKKVESDMQKLVAKDDTLSKNNKLLQTVSGVGNTVAMTLLAALPELGNRSSKQLASLVGVAPQTYNSGLKTGYAKTGHGRHEVRKALYMAALVGTRYNPVLKEFYERLRAKGKPAKVALVACMRKLLTILNAIIKTKTPWIYA